MSSAPSTKAWSLGRTAPSDSYDLNGEYESKSKHHSVMRVFEKRRHWGCGSIAITLVVFLLLFCLSLNAFAHGGYEETHDSLRSYYRELGYTKRQMALGPESDGLPDSVRPIAYAVQRTREARSRVASLYILLGLALVGFCFDVAVPALSFAMPLFTFVFILVPGVAAWTILNRAANSLAASTMGVPFAVYQELVQHHNLHASTAWVSAFSAWTAETCLLIALMTIVILAIASRKRV